MHQRSCAKAQRARSARFRGASPRLQKQASPRGTTACTGADLKLGAQQHVVVQLRRLEHLKAGERVGRRVQLPRCWRHGGDAGGGAAEEECHELQVGRQATARARQARQRMAPPACRDA